MKDHLMPSLIEQAAVEIHVIADGVGRTTRDASAAAGKAGDIAARADAVGFDGIVKGTEPGSG